MTPDVSGDSVTPAELVPSKPPSVAREFSSLWLRLAQYGLLFVSTLLVARALGPSGRAEYALAFALSGAIWVLANLSVEGAAGRLVGREEAQFEDVAGALALCTLVMSVVGIGLTVCLGVLGRGEVLPSAPLSIFLVSGLSIPGLLATQIGGYLLLMRGRVRTYALAAVVAAAAQLITVLVLLLTARLDPLSAAIATTVGFLVSGILMNVALAHEGGLRMLAPRFDGPLVRELLRTSAGIHPMSVAIQLGPRVELLVVGVLTSARETGLYSLALTVAQMPLLAAWTLAQAGVGPVTNLPERKAVEYGCEFTRQAALVGLVLALAGDAAAYPFVRVAYGSAWTGAAVPLIILLTGTVAWAIENPLRVLLLRVASPAQMAFVALGSLLLNAGLTVALMAPWGIVGAALASFIAYWTLAGGMVWLLIKAVRQVPLRQSLRRLSRADWAISTALGIIGRVRLVVTLVRHGGGDSPPMRLRQ